MLKKVRDCTVDELENYYIHHTGFIPDHIDIYWYDVRFMKYSSKTEKYEVDFWCYDIYELDGFNGYLQVDICYNTVKEFKLNGQKASVSENIKALNEENKRLANNILYSLECAKNSWNNTEYLNIYLSEAISYFIDISNNMSDFLGYYLTFSFLK